MKFSLAILMFFAIPSFSKTDNYNFLKVPSLTNQKGKELKQMKDQSRFRESFQTPKCSVFCRMENGMYKKYKLNLRIRTGGY